MGRSTVDILRLAGATAVLVLSSIVAACERNEYAPPPPPVVTVARPMVEDVTQYLEQTGTTRAVESVEVRARVKGFLQSMHFEPGQVVEKDTLLFVIDPKPFEIALAAAEAELASLRAELDLAQTEFERTRTIYKRGASSELDLVRARAKRDKAQAAVQGAAATVQAARLDLDYAYVKAPIRGRVGRRLVDIGNLVGAEGATHLTDLVRYSPLHVYFYLSERDVLSLQQRSYRRRVANANEYRERELLPVEVGRAGEEGFPHAGRVDFTALQIDPATGTFEVRALLENAGDPDEVIIPGTFVRVRLPIGEKKDALLVSERAIGMDQNGTHVFVVDADNVIEQRSIELGPLMDDRRVVEAGLRRDDWVVVNGLQRARPGARVERRRVEAAGGPLQDAEADPPSAGTR